MAKRQASAKNKRLQPFSLATAKSEKGPSADSTSVQSLAKTSIAVVHDTPPEKHPSSPSNPTTEQEEHSAFLSHRPQDYPEAPVIARGSYPPPANSQTSSTIQQSHSLPLTVRLKERIDCDDPEIEAVLYVMEKSLVDLVNKLQEEADANSAARGNSYSPTRLTMVCADDDSPDAEAKCSARKARRSEKRRLKRQAKRKDAADQKSNANSTGNLPFCACPYCSAITPGPEIPATNLNATKAALHPQPPTKTASNATAPQPRPASSTPANDHPPPQSSGIRTSNMNQPYVPYYPTTVPLVPALMYPPSISSASGPNRAPSTPFPQPTYPLHQGYYSYPAPYYRAPWALQIILRTPGMAAQNPGNQAPSVQQVPREYTTAKGPGDEQQKDSNKAQERKKPQKAGGPRKTVSFMLDTESESELDY